MSSAILVHAQSGPSCQGSKSGPVLVCPPGSSTPPQGIPIPPPFVCNLHGLMGCKPIGHQRQYQNTTTMTKNESLPTFFIQYLQAADVHTRVLPSCTNRNKQVTRVSRDIVMQRVKEIVSNEHRPVSLLDFLPSFEVQGKMYHMKYGTLRNIFSTLRRTRQIQIAFKTKQTFYTLPGITFGKSKMMTPYHTGVPSSSSSTADNDSLYRLIQNLPIGRNALHDPPQI